MAYSDYGGYAFRNGKRIEERSDCTITPDGDTFGTPGIYPGFAMAAAGLPHDEIMKRIEWPSGHAVLGDGPIYVVLYKQHAQVFRGPQRLDVVPYPSYEKDEITSCEVDGVHIEVRHVEDDNHYAYARLVQPDGVVWCGWSGYGVGAGLEDAGYGFSTRERNDALVEIWPDAIRTEE